MLVESCPRTYSLFILSLLTDFRISYHFLSLHFSGLNICTISPFYLPYNCREWMAIKMEDTTWERCVLCYMLQFILSQGNHSPLSAPPNRLLCTSTSDYFYFSFSMNMYFPPSPSLSVSLSFSLSLYDSFALPLPLSYSFFSFSIFNPIVDFISICLSPS